MSEILDLFRRFAKVDYSVVVPTPVYREFDVPVRRHRRRRIQKKWLKRYGTRTVKKLDYIYDRPITSPRDLSTRDVDREILLNIVIRPHVASDTVRMPVLPTFNYTDPPEASVPIESVTYQFPKIGMVQRLSYEFYCEFYKNPDMQKAIFDQCLRRAEPMIENGTKVNGMSGYGDLESDTIEF